MIGTPDWTEYTERDIREDEYPLSASAVKTFKNCPRQFELQYTENRPRISPSSDYGDLGSAVHEAIERVLQEQNGVNVLDAQNQLESLMFGEYRSIEPDIPDSMFEDGLQYLEVAARYIAGRDVDTIRGEEQTFEVGMEDPVDVSFRGIMDVATEREVWDWKTGKIREEAEMIQGMIYALGYYHVFGEVPDRIRFVYLKEEKERKFKPTDENYQKMMKYVHNVIDAKESGEFIAKPDESKCYWCSMEGWCDASRVGAGGIDYEVF